MDMQYQQDMAFKEIIVSTLLHILNNISKELIMIYQCPIL